MVNTEKLTSETPKQKTLKNKAIFVFFIIIMCSGIYVFLKSTFAQIPTSLNFQEKGAEEITFSTEELEKKIKKLKEEIALLRHFFLNCASISFNRDLYFGLSGQDVKCLQVILNLYSLETKVAESGDGSLGQETEYFGVKTREAVIKFQNLHKEEILFPLGLFHGTGYVGPKTRAILNNILETFPKTKFNSLENLIQELEKIKNNLSGKISEKLQSINEKKPEPSPTLQSTPIPSQTFSPISSSFRRTNFQPSPRNNCGQVPVGEQVYTISTKTNPRFVEVIINPINISSGGLQTVRTKIYDPQGNPITHVEGQGILDNTITPFVLHLIEGNEVNGVWEGTWQAPEDFCLKYQISLTATSASGKNSVTLTLLTFP